MHYGDQVAKEVVENLIEMLESGIVDDNWSAPWKNLGGTFPANAFSRKEYRGWNIFALAFAAMKNGYSSPYWATFNQWKAAGHKVKKGTKTEAICFWQPSKYTAQKPDGTEEERKSLLFKVYRVINADCVEGWTAPTVESLDPFTPIQRCEETVKATGATIHHGGDRACFIPSLDQIHMPKPEQFKSPEYYYSVLFHELTHWTGASNRLEREFGKRFGDEAYAFEELVAELGSAILSAKHGIEAVTRDCHAKYLKNWIKVLRADPKALWTAGSKAQQASEYIMNAEQIQNAEAA